MAGVSPWLLASLALLPPLGLAVALAVRGPSAHRLVGVQMLGSVAVLQFAALTFVFDQASSIDLAVLFGLLSLPAALLYGIVLERWL